MFGLRTFAFVLGWGVWASGAGPAKEGAAVIWIAIFWLVGGLVFDGWRGDRLEGMPPFHDAIISFASIVAWPLTLSIVIWRRWHRENV